MAICAAVRRANSPNAPERFAKVPVVRPTIAPRSPSRKWRSDRWKESGKLPVSSTAPVRLSDAISESASTTPSMPPAGKRSVPGMPGGQQRERRADAEEQQPGSEYLDHGRLNFGRANPSPGQHPKQQRDGEGAQSQQLEDKDRRCTIRRIRSGCARAVAPETEFQEGSCG